MQDDLISREDALSKIAKLNTTFITNPEVIKAIADSLRILEKLPSVIPKQETGEWVVKSNRYKVCSECDTYFDTWSYELPYDKFCPNCGTKMKKEGSE